MEIDQHIMAGCTLHEFDAIVHVHLVVTAEEIDLHSGNAEFFAPCEFLLTILWIIKTELRAWSSIDPSDRRVVPYHRLDSLRMCICNRILNGLAILHLVPLGIDEHIREAESRRHVDIFLDDIVVV